MLNEELDLAGLKCPLPALRTARALDGLPPGASLRVIATDPLATLDIPNLVRERGDRLLAIDEVEGGHAFLIQRAIKDHKTT